jgi:hypothetical protein
MIKTQNPFNDARLDFQILSLEDLDNLPTVRCDDDYDVVAEGVEQTYNRSLEDADEYQVFVHNFNDKLLTMMLNTSWTILELKTVLVKDLGISDVAQIRLQVGIKELPVKGYASDFVPPYGRIQVKLKLNGGGRQKYFEQPQDVYDLQEFVLGRDLKDKVTVDEKLSSIDEYQIFIQNFDGKLMTMLLNSSWNLLDFKNIISQDLKLDANSIRLQVGTKELPLRGLASEYIRPYDRVQLKLRLKGGMEGLGQGLGQMAQVDNMINNSRNKRKQNKKGKTYQLAQVSKDFKTDLGYDPTYQQVLQMHSDQNQKLALALQNLTKITGNLSKMDSNKLNNVKQTYENALGRETATKLDPEFNEKSKNDQIMDLQFMLLDSPFAALSGLLLPVLKEAGQFGADMVAKHFMKAKENLPAWARWLRAQAIQYKFLDPDEDDKGDEYAVRCDPYYIANMLLPEFYEPILSHKKETLRTTTIFQHEYTMQYNANAAGSLGIYFFPCNPFASGQQLSGPATCFAMVFNDTTFNIVTGTQVPPPIYASTPIANSWGLVNGFIPAGCAITVVPGITGQAQSAGLLMMGLWNNITNFTAVTQQSIASAPFNHQQTCATNARISRIPGVVDGDSIQFQNGGGTICPNAETIYILLSGLPANQQVTFIVSLGVEYQVSPNNVLALNPKYSASHAYTTPLLKEIYLKFPQLAFGLAKDMTGAGRDTELQRFVKEFLGLGTTNYNKLMRWLMTGKVNIPHNRINPLGGGNGGIEGGYHGSQFSGNGYGRIGDSGEGLGPDRKQKAAMLTRLIKNELQEY